MIIDGKKIAKDLRKNLKNEIENLKNNIKPYLVVILIGDNTASKIYVKNKEKSASEVGIKSKVIKFEVNINEKDLINKIEDLNSDTSVHGILVQLPLPKHIDERKIISKINPLKDVDGFHPVNVGNLSSGNDAMIPCTPLGCYLLLKDTIQNLSGKNVVIIGRSNINGKPMAQLLLKENCTVTVAHSKTKNIEKICQHADIIVVAVGKPKMINKDWVNKNSVVIDVGINRIEEKGFKKIVGDADFENIKNEVSAITPVPGGVGPMTIACLLKNTLKAYKNQVK
ncbi:MAG: bifunctional methylenetetrahydrofolate dehydrogenase/methenyltetrahydrofolate cyclohydrolase FolD [Candidatus Pelagibacter sp.]|nr:bifunctional methylenetetrahydrofolate dehydrogenase/methenyltetrahydrofolate cyclohydrolase FolD [Candidatus Pelagibacter sp.]OUV97665.1 MAG: bifunctional methylenetetrahydrofolate dehydrogenase/methenyltetrahydrofolate cyclohydrolase [Candidatus Pelagibacter sp. TMED142]|tara:strand:- start:390 stop:1238 length:849 start_codon:yes stop_codon:yes gene_type:complete